MPRAKKRKSEPVRAVPASAKSCRLDSVRYASSRATFKEQQGDNLFNTYANKSLGVIDPEGIEALCWDVGVHHTDVRILILAWKLNAEKQGYFTQEEWRKGMNSLKIDTISELKKALLELETEVKKPENFENFYLYAFQYCLTEDKQKFIDIETVCALLDLVLGSQFRTQVDAFTKFLKIQHDYKMINMDQWTGFFRFCNEITFPDFENYDPTSAWPLILDNFVDWMREKQA